MPSVTGTGWVLRFLPTQAMLWFCDSMKWSLVFSFRLNWLVKQISVSLQHHVLQTQVLYSRCSTMFCWLLLPHLYLFSKPLHGFLTGAGRKYSIPSQEIKLTFVILSWLCHQAWCCCHLTAFWMQFLGLQFESCFGTKIKSTGCCKTAAIWLQSDADKQHPRRQAPAGLNLKSLIATPTQWVLLLTRLRCAGFREASQRALHQSPSQGKKRQLQRKKEMWCGQESVLLKCSQLRLHSCAAALSPNPVLWSQARRASLLQSAVC